MRAKWLVALVVASLAALASFDEVAAQQKWKAVATSRPTPQFALWTWLGEELDKRTNGQVKLDVVSLPELGLTGFELVRVTRAGLVDVSDIILTYVAGDVPIIEGVDLPESEPSTPAEPAVEWERRAEDLAKRMEERINESVFRSLERSLGDLGRRR